MSTPDDFRLVANGNLVLFTLYSQTLQSNPRFLCLMDAAGLFYLMCFLIFFPATPPQLLSQVQLPLITQSPVGSVTWINSSTAVFVSSGFSNSVSYYIITISGNNIW